MFLVCVLVMFVVIVIVVGFLRYFVEIGLIRM